MRLSFCMRLSLLLLSCYDTANEYTTLSRFGACARRVLQGLRMNLVTVNCSFKHHNTTATKRTKKDAGMERSKKKKQEQTSKKKRKEKEPTDAERTEKKRTKKNAGIERSKTKKKKNKNKPATEKRKRKKNCKLIAAFL